MKIGFVNHLTGDAAVYGQSMKKGTEIALDEINADWASQHVAEYYEAYQVKGGKWVEWKKCPGRRWPGLPMMPRALPRSAW